MRAEKKSGKEERKERNKEWTEWKTERREDARNWRIMKMDLRRKTEDVVKGKEKVAEGVKLILERDEGN